MNPIKYGEMIDEKVKSLSPDEKKEVFNFVEFISLKKLKREDLFLAALKEGQAIGKKLNIAPKDIDSAIKQTRKKR